MLLLLRLLDLKKLNGILIISIYHVLEYKSSVDKFIVLVYIAFKTLLNITGIWVQYSVRELCDFDPWLQELTYVFVICIDAIKIIVLEL